MLASLDRLRAGEERLAPANLTYLGRGIRLFAVELIYGIGITIIALVIFLPAFALSVNQGQGSANASLIAAAVLLNLIGFSVITLLSLALTFAMPAIVLATDRGGVGAGINVGAVSAPIAHESEPHFDRRPYADRRQLRRLDRSSRLWRRCGRDLGVRAGDAGLDNPQLRKGVVRRSSGVRRSQMSDLPPPPPPGGGFTPPPPPPGGGFTPPPHHLAEDLRHHRHHLAEDLRHRHHLLVEASRQRRRRAGSYRSRPQVTRPRVLPAVGPMVLRSALSSRASCHWSAFGLSASASSLVPPPRSWVSSHASESPLAMERWVGEASRSRA